MKYQNNIQKIRKQHKLTQQELADEVGITSRTLQRYESGESEIKLSKATILADYFDVPVSEIVNYNVPEDSVIITKDTYDLLVDGFNKYEAIKSSIRNLLDL
ncbi:helix-turn-helix transcriptional regulator [Streptococcus suis]|uniref:helix-turn-helix transcriptional regulator n=1 Tax=Streptococcus suis TaxID=1307 RepID=UPI002AB392D9|nr:helix-turn-helix transcriptional regulator [Streptococcus suis]MDY7602323.1 helix-turn-helix transcriptional regulator [Streptococcus suis]